MSRAICLAMRHTLFKRCHVGIIGHTVSSFQRPYPDQRGRRAPGRAPPSNPLACRLFLQNHQLSLASPRGSTNIREACHTLEPPGFDSALDVAIKSMSAFPSEVDLRESLQGSAKTAARPLHSSSPRIAIKNRRGFWDRSPNIIQT